MALETMVQGLRIALITALNTEHDVLETGGQVS
jgi:pyroglutamyl-peptidase